jgi:HemY protein
MRKLFAIILVALLLGVGVVAVIETDPGYVLVSYGNYTLETSLWVGLLLLLLFTLLIYAVLRLVYRLVGGQRYLVSWLGTRKAHHASRLTTRGVTSFVEGNWSKARGQLLRGAQHNDAPLINYLLAARSSHHLDDADGVSVNLGAAQDVESAAAAVELTRAEMLLHAGQQQQAIDTLEPLRRNAARHPRVLELLRLAFHGLQDWEKLAGLLPELKKHKLLAGDDLQQLQSDTAVGLLLQSAAAGEDQLGNCWQKLPAELKRDPQMVRRYAGLLVEHGANAAAEKVILRALKQQWDPALVRHYGYLESDNVPAQLAKAESWLAAHPEDAELLLCLGRLSARDKLWGKARDYFESSYRLQHTSETCAELGRLLVALGEPKVAAAYFREGLLLEEEDKLPQLPMPEKLVPHSQRLAGS